MWVMSDRAIPRSYRTMQGFGVHTFRLVNAQGESKLCKFHWLPKAGTHSLVWDEAVKIAGADPDFHRRDLWEAIEHGAFPEYELALQVFGEDDAERFSFDVLDATKIVPEELVPLRVVGRMVLDRNPDNFFAETEQVAFCTANVVRGIDFTNDPLLQGRNHSYIDTQISRLGGANFHEIPINAPLAPIHNNQRDGMHRRTVNRGRVSYEPNSLAGGCPFQAGLAGGGYVSFPQPVHEDKLRGKPEKFADHYTQARLFYRSQSAVEQSHIAAAFRFELSKVTVPAVRERVLSLLVNVDAGLAAKVAAGLGMAVPKGQPPVLKKVAKPEVELSPALSLFARPGEGGVRGRRIALLVDAGIDAASLMRVRDALMAAGAMAQFVGPLLGTLKAGGAEVAIEKTLENAPSAVWDAAVLPDGDMAALLAQGRVPEFLRDQYRHCKPLLALGAGARLLERAGIPTALPGGGADPGILVAEAADTAAAITAFETALAKHRHFERETDPPAV
jgi:catalase